MFVRCLIVAVMGAFATSAHAQFSSFRLSNGVSVSVNTIDEAEAVAMESSYAVGFMNEPEGMVQAAHLLEHLVCYSPCLDFGDRGAMEYLNQVGMANAETLPAFTHYDYVAPTNEFEKIVQIEVGRLRGISFERGAILREAKRCYQETDFVEKNPQVGMLKHAFMACSHAWRFQSQRALVRGGMEEFSVDDLKQFHAAFYTPIHLSIAITGAVSRDDAKRILEKHIGAVPSRPRQVADLDWTRVPATHTIRWDSKVRGVCIAWESPPKANERAALSILASLTMQQLVNDGELRAVCDHVSCSNNTWPVGDLPLFVYATARDRGELDKLKRILVDRFAKLMTQSCAIGAGQLSPFAQQGQHRMSWADMQRAVPFLEQQGRTRKDAIRLCLMQDALNHVIYSRMIGTSSDPIVDLKQLADEKPLAELVARTLTAESQRIVHIVPLDEARAQ